MLTVRTKYWRTRRALGIKDLAKVAKVSSSTIENIELRNHIPQPAVLKRLAAALNVTLDELIVDVQDEKAPAA